MKTVSLSLVLLAAIFVSFKEQEQPVIHLQGTIADVNGIGIPYVNIGISEKAVGTVSTKHGKFDLTIPADFSRDSLTISSVGFEASVIAIDSLVKSKKLSNITFILQRSFVSLPEVIVSSNPLKHKVIGNKTRSKFLSGGFSSSDLGSEAGTRIKIKRSPTFLDSVSFHLSYNKMDSLKVRVNIYDMSTGDPGINLLPENVIIKLGNKRTGIVNIDLTKYKLRLKDDILVALELVEAAGDAQSGVFLSASVLGAPTYYRETSQAKWKKYESLSLGINCSVRF